MVFLLLVDFIIDKTASNIDLAGNAWFGQANISSKNTQSTMKINSYSAS